MDIISPKVLHSAQYSYLYSIRSQTQIKMNKVLFFLGIRRYNYIYLLADPATRCGEISNAHPPICYLDPTFRNFRIVPFILLNIAYRQCRIQMIQKFLSFVH